MVGLYLGFATRFLLSLRLTAGTAPIAVRDIVFTAVVAMNFFGFFLRLGISQSDTTSLDEYKRQSAQGSSRTRFWILTG